jgi:phosphoribosylformylglycinamidine (FGAM) synthase PurS component
LRLGDGLEHAVLGLVDEGLEQAVELLAEPLDPGRHADLEHALAQVAERLGERVGDQRGGAVAEHLEQAGQVHVRERRAADVLDVVVDQTEQGGPVGAICSAGRSSATGKARPTSQPTRALCSASTCDSVAREAHRARPRDRLACTCGGRRVDRRVEGTVKVGDLDVAALRRDHGGVAVFESRCVRVADHQVADPRGSPAVRTVRRAHATLPA